MVHFYESSIIITKDNIYSKVFANEHPEGYLIAKPKYIPSNMINSSVLPLRFLFGQAFHRLDTWKDKEELTKYINEFKRVYPDYIYHSELHDNWFFVVPRHKIERIYDPKQGLKELMKIPENQMDDHLKSIYKFINFLFNSGVSIDDFGITHSTLAGHYVHGKSDINIVVMGKDNYWKLMNFLKTAEHPLLRWKNNDEWSSFRHGRSRSNNFTENEFLHSMKRKKSEGFFNGSFFVLFGVEKPYETWERWGDERYIPQDIITVEGEVVNNYNSIVRPGYYEIKNSKVIDGENVDIKKVVFYSRDYIMQAEVGEKIRACGLLEKVEPRNGSAYYRVVIGYFDSSISERRDKEYIKVIE